MTRRRGVCSVGAAVTRLDDIGGNIPAAIESVSVPSYVIDPAGVIRC